MDHHPGERLQDTSVQRSRKSPLLVEMEHAVRGGRCAMNPRQAPGHAQPGLANMSDRAGRDSLLDQHDSVAQQGGRFLPQGGHPPSRHGDMEQVLEQSCGAGHRQVVHIQQIGADSVQPRPMEHSALHIDRKHTGPDRVTRAPFPNPNPLMLDRLHLDRWHINDVALRGNRPRDEM